jgi:alpha-tubulin suppressor-like RCC1 family protein
MPNFSGKWTLTEQAQGAAAGTWTGLPLYELYTFGAGSLGRLGHNDTIDLSSPVQVGELTTWSQVSTKSKADGTIAIKTDGTLWAWGAGTQGQLGNNTSITKILPSPSRCAYHMG